MKIKLLFFGALTDVIGAQEEIVEVNDNLDITYLNLDLLSRYPSLSNFKYKIALNKIVVDKDQKLKEGDEVAFLPPFAGG
jgi:molybdopterin converting factor small subunit